MRLLEEATCACLCSQSSGTSLRSLYVEVSVTLLTCRNDEIGTGADKCYSHCCTCTLLLYSYTSCTFLVRCLVRQGRRRIHCAEEMVQQCTADAIFFVFHPCTCAHVRSCELWLLWLMKPLYTHTDIQWKDCWSLCLCRVLLLYSSHTRAPLGKWLSMTVPSGQKLVLNWQIATPATEAVNEQYNALTHTTKAH